MRQDRRVTPSQLPTVSVHDAGDAALLLDVREDAEWVQGHAPQAVHVPMSELVARLHELPGDRPLHVVCHVGGRSAQVTAHLLSQGRDARNVDGGMDAWARSGRPVLTDTGAPGRVV